MINKLILFSKHKVMNELLICCMSFEFIKYLIYRKYYVDVSNPVYVTDSPGMFNEQWYNVDGLACSILL